MIVPTLNDCAELKECVASLRNSVACARAAVEILVADGGSGDGTIQWALDQTDLILVHASRGRANQMNAAASRARASWFLFLHADSRIEPGLIAGILPRLNESKEAGFSFDLRLRNDAPVFRRMERGVAWRCARLGLPYGDQGLCVSRGLFRRMGGFRPDALAEDLDFALRMRAHGGIVMLPHRVESSTRQWDRQGVVIGTMYNLGRLAAGAALHYLRGENRPTR